MPDTLSIIALCLLGCTGEPDLELGRIILAPERVKIELPTLSVDEPFRPYHGTMRLQSGASLANKPDGFEYYEAETGVLFLIKLTTKA